MGQFDVHRKSSMIYSCKDSVTLHVISTYISDSYQCGYVSGLVFVFAFLVFSNIVSEEKIIRKIDLESQ